MKYAYQIRSYVNTTIKKKCLQRNLWYRPPASMTSHLASVTFKMASKVFIEETDKNFDFIKTRFKYFFGMKCPVV